MAERGEWVRIGWVARPHGLRGEVRVVPDTDFPERFHELRTVWVVRGGEAEACAVESVRPAGGAFLVKLAGVAGRAEADRLRGAALCVPRGEARALPEGTFYVADLIGSEVRTEDGELLGRVAEVLRGAAHDVYVVRGPRGEVLLPAVREVVREVSVREGRVVVRLLPGLGEA